MAELLHKELSYAVVGILFKVYNELGGGYQEKYYQKAIALELKYAGINFREQVPVKLTYNNRSIGGYYLDFIVDNKVVLEIKVTPRFYNRDIKQVLSYLKSTNIELGILASFNRNCLKFKRLLRGKISDNS